MQNYNNYLNCANFLTIIFKKFLQSFPKQKRILFIISNLQFL